MREAKSEAAAATRAVMTLARSPAAVLGQISASVMAGHPAAATKPFCVVSASPEQQAAVMEA